MVALRKLTLAELLFFAGGAETVLFAFFFAWVAFDETSFFENRTKVGRFGLQSFRDGELDGVDLTGETAASDTNRDVVIFLLLSKS